MPEIYPPAEDSYLMSEVLKKEVPKLLQENSQLKVLEIGCGSGIQLQALKEIGVKNILACDINPDAVAHCKKLGFNCIKSNLFSNIKEEYNVIIFNPPYLPTDAREPEKSRVSTTGGKNGSEIINKFLKNAKEHLARNGKIFLLTSSLTKKINWENWKKKKLAEKKLFFERIWIWELV